MLAPLCLGRLPGQPGLQVGQRVQHGSPTAADADTGDMPVLGQLPQKAGEMPRAFAASRGRRARGRGVGIIVVLQRIAYREVRLAQPLASVPYRDWEQARVRTRMQRIVWECELRSTNDVFPI